MENSSKYSNMSIFIFIIINIVFKRILSQTQYITTIYLSSQYSPRQPFMPGISRIKGFVTELPRQPSPPHPQAYLCTISQIFVRHFNNICTPTPKIWLVLRFMHFLCKSKTKIKVKKIICNSNIHCDHTFLRVWIAE